MLNYKIILCLPYENNMSIDNKIYTTNFIKTLIKDTTVALVSTSTIHLIWLFILYYVLAERENNKHLRLSIEPNIIHTTNKTIRNLYVNFYIDPYGMVCFRASRKNLVL